ncbi:MAG TPA: S8 family serine peptidase [Bacteroidales bacterium]|nr:S8 family serine peptidase [Bacteroidales bacterium]
MKKIQLLFIALVLTIFNLQAQTVETNFVDGVIYLKFVDEFPLDFQVNEDRSVDLDQFPFLQKVFEKYEVYGAAQTLYLFDDPKLLRTLSVGFSAITQVNEFIKELSAIPEIEYAEKISIKRPLYTPNDPYYGTVGGANLKWHLDKINASTAWDLQQGTANIKVAIVDNAVWGAHPDLQISSSNLCKIGGSYNPTPTVGSASPPSSVNQNMTCSQSTFYTSCAAYDWSHGTHCAGLAGAMNNNSVGVASIGGGVTLMGVRIADDNGDMYYGNYGVQWAAQNGAKVISMSYGSFQEDATERNLMQACYNAGIILVAAAGNEGDQGNYINYPAGYSTVISVASIDQNGKLSDFSQYGAGRANIAAPGGYSSQNLNIVSTTFCTSQYLRLAGYSSLNGQYYDGMQGTSMACPIVAGLCGLLASAYPNITPAQALSCLQSTASPLASGSNQIDGNGYVNARAAVQCALDLAGGGDTPPVGECDWHTNLLESDEAGFLFDQDHTSSIYKYAEIFTNTSTVQLDSVAVYTYKVHPVTSSSTINVKICSANGLVPGTVLATKAIPYNQLQNNGWNYIPFSPSLNINGTFFVVVELNQTPTTDTVRLVLTSSEGRTDADATAYAYYNNEWRRIADLFVAGNPQTPLIGSFFIGAYMCPEGGTQTCNAPTNLTATPNHNTRKIYLSWNGVSGATSYLVFRNGTQIASNITATNYTDNNAAVNVTYTYTVKAVCPSGTSQASNSATAKLLQTGINELESALVSIYPNPFNNVLTISLSTTSIKDVQIIDMTGRVIKQYLNVGKAETELELNNLSNAVYFIRITTTDGSYYYDKIIKQ